ncbi:radical SAM protein [bacterium]|nr:radical SAM protein [bacterium]
MNCGKENRQRLKVETDKAIYLIEFGQIQIEITGRCNMRCQHCRASNEDCHDMPLEQIIKIMQFARNFSPNYKEIIVSGGEPILHRQFTKTLTAIRKMGGESLTLTTNGSLFKKEHLDLLEQLQFHRCILSVSLDSLDPRNHDAFRRYSGAYDKALKAIQLIVKRQLPNVIASVRMTLRPEQIVEMKKMAQFVYDLGCNRVNFSGIHPVGAAKNSPDFWMDKKQKRQFVENVMTLRQQFPKSFRIETNDPLFCLVRGYSEIGKDDRIIFDGCGAAAITFNVSTNGNMTPCALLDLPIMNVFNLSVDEMAIKYQQSEIVKNMLDMNLSGKCGDCAKKYQCGGCRARAFERNGDYLAEDPDCWL